MKWFIDLNTKSKLVLGFSLLLLILAGVIILAYGSVSSIKKSQFELYHQNYLGSVKLVELRANQNRTRADFLEIFLTRDAGKLRSLEDDIRTRAKDIDGLIRDIAEILRNEHDSEAQKKFEELTALREAYRMTRDQEFALIAEGKYDEARRLSSEVQEERYNKIRAIALDLGNREMERATSRVARAESSARNILIVFIAAGTAAIFLSIMSVLILNKQIASPLKEITGVAEKIAFGDLSAHISSMDRVDEVGALTRSFSDMTVYLRELADTAVRVAAGDLTSSPKAKSGSDMLGQAVSAMTESLRSMTKELQSSISVLASSASEILSSTTEVASSVTETASAVNETTTTVEEVKQTAYMVSAKAQNVSETAQKAAQVSRDGSRAVDETQEKMNRIRGQMESIALSVVRLSEQSQAIGEIIQTVNDLADQSNLLAVNASIEAAKAGEHGKGFAVVAQEVKSLADQSKQATAQVRGILNDIQKATSTAVMATEQGSKAVDEGVRQSSEAGESIKMLAVSITEAASAAIQIAASTQQQLVGMEQVISAMNNIKQAAEQNVAGMKQTEDAAHNIHDQGQKLKVLVERYKV